VKVATVKKRFIMSRRRPLGYIDDMPIAANRDYDRIALLFVGLIGWRRRS